MQSHKCPTIGALITQQRSLVLHTPRAGQGRILSSTGEVRFLRLYLYFPLVDKRTGVPVLPYEALPERRTAADLAGFGVDCLLSPGGCSPGRALETTHRLYILWSNKLIIGILGRDCGRITITAGPIRSRNRTPTKHLGSPVLDHYIRYYQAYLNLAT